VEGIKPTQPLVEEWMSFTYGSVYYKDAVDGQFGREHWPELRMIFHRMVKKGFVENDGRDGWFRLVEDKNAPVDWQSVIKGRDSGLILPFELREHVFIHPDTTIVVAGSKSSGKTGFLYRTVAMNMNRTNVVLLTNLEGGISMLRDRFDAMDIEIPVPAPFKVIPVYENFHDYVKAPNTLYVIDYIDVNEQGEFYKIGGKIKKIDQKLQGMNSNAVVGLQKPLGRDMAFGKDQTMKVASLYIAMDSSRLKIVDAKVSADKKVHPKNMAWTFLYDNEGTRFVNIQPDYGGE